MGINKSLVLKYYTLDLTNMLEIAGEKESPRPMATLLYGTQYRKSKKRW